MKADATTVASLPVSGPVRWALLGARVEYRMSHHDGYRLLPEGVKRRPIIPVQP